MTKVHREKRKAFAKKFRGFNFKKTIFSDEKIFRVRPGGVVRQWRLHGESRFLPKYVLNSTQKPEGLMVWAAMKSDGQICIRRCPPKVNASRYQDILQSAIGFIRPPYVDILIDFAFCSIFLYSEVLDGNLCRMVHPLIVL